MLPILKNILKLLIFLGIGIGIMYYLYDKNQTSYLEHCQQQMMAPEDCSLFKKLKTDFSQLNYFWIGLIFVGFAMTNYSRTRRWQIILETMNYKPGFGNAFSAVCIAYLANLGFPRIGEFVRAGVLARQENLPVEKVFGSVVLDRVADMLSFIALVLLAFCLDWKTFEHFFEKYAQLPSFHLNYYSVGIIILLAGIVWFFRNSILDIKIVGKFYAVIQGVLTSLKSIRNLKKRNAFILHTVLIWVWFFLMFVFACKSFNPTAALKPVQMLVVYVFGSFGVFIPSPGGMGTYHYLVALSLGLYGILQADAFSFANIAFTWGQFLALILFGTASLIWTYALSPRKLKGKHPE